MSSTTWALAIRFRYRRLPAWASAICWTRSANISLNSPKEEEEDERPRIAIVGKPNVGKSSIVNRLVGENRVIVSDVAGTTRDAIDTTVRYNKKEYVFTDTAGLRRKNKIKEEIDATASSVPLRRWSALMLFLL